MPNCAWWQNSGNRKTDIYQTSTVTLTAHAQRVNKAGARWEIGLPACMSLQACVPIAEQKNHNRGIILLIAL